jgi:RecB family exonuclease
MTDFTNTHLSYSRLARFEQCPLSFKLHYVDGLRAEPGVPLRFGKAVHAVLETLVKEHVANEDTGPLSANRTTELWQREWLRGDLTGNALFGEGLTILRSFIASQADLDRRNVLAVEQEFRLPVGPFSVLGFIDRADRIGDDAIEVVDYKTNRVLFSEDDMATSLQLGLYCLAATQLWPWAKEIKLTYRMLRHGVRLSTTRTDEELEAVLAYVDTLGRATEEATEFPPRLNANCVYCDHRRQCPAYAEALRGQVESVCQDMDDVDAVSRERQELANITKILWARKAELEGILKAHLHDRDELTAGGVRYSMVKAARVTYPLEPAVTVLANATGRPRDELVTKLAVADKKAVDSLVKKFGKELSRPQVRLLKAELDALAKKSWSARLRGKAANKQAV